MTEIARNDERLPARHTVVATVTAVWVPACGLTAFLAWGLLMKPSNIAQHLALFGRFDGLVLICVSILPLLAAMVSTYNIVIYEDD